VSRTVASFGIIGTRSIALRLVDYPRGALEKPFGGILKSFNSQWRWLNKATLISSSGNRFTTSCGVNTRNGSSQNGESPICDFYEARLVQLLADPPDAGADRARTTSAIRNLFEIAAQRERKAREVWVARRIWRFCAT